MGDQVKSKVTALDVKDALAKRWPDGEYIRVEEAPDGPERLGRKLDLVVVSLWKSRGYELDGVEIKVSTSDWKRELEKPGKADWWWDRVHRFWIAVPVAIVERVRAELPTGWGLIAVQGGMAREVVKAVKHEPTPLTWAQCVGLLRAHDGAGPSALARAHEKGYKLGQQHAEAVGARDAPDARVQRDLDALRAKVATFRDACGIDIEAGWSTTGAERVGRLAALAQQYIHNPDGETDRMRRWQSEMSALAGKVGRLIDDFAASHDGSPPP